MKLFKEHFQSKLGRREVFLSEGVYLYAPVCAHRAHTHTHPKTGNIVMHTELSPTSLLSALLFPWLWGMPTFFGFPLCGATLPDLLSRWGCPFLTFMYFFP